MIRSIVEQAAARGRGRAQLRSDSGAAAVEFAIVSLLLITLVFGIIEFSLLLRDHVSVTSAVRTAARVASSSPGGAVHADQRHDLPGLAPAGAGAGGC